MKLAVVALISSAVAVNEHPLTKIVNLLKDMEAQLTADAKADKTTYEKLACWCKNTKESKVAAISTAQSRITDLTAAVQEYAASEAEADTNIKQLKKEVNQGENALAQARAGREQAAAAWYADEKDLVQAIAALKNAIQQLSLRGGASLIHIGHVAERVMTRHEANFVGKMTQEQRQVIAALQQPASTGSYTLQSDKIMGVLSSMLEEMEKDLATGRSDDAMAASQYENLKADKTAENAAGKQAIRTTKTEASAAATNLERSKEDLSDTRAALDADRKFLSDLNLRCQNVDHDYSERVSDRSAEISAVQDAITILTEDSGSETMGRALSLLQVGAARAAALSREARGRVAGLLLAAAKRTGNADLLKLAGTVSLDTFTKIKAACEKMISELKQQQVDEVKQRDFCVSEFSTNEKETAAANRQKSELENKIEDLESLIAKLTAEMEDLTKQIADVKLQVKQAGQNRESENADFQATINDQRQTQAILAKAITRLQVVYAKTQEERLAASGSAGALVQQEPGAAAAPPPPGFDKQAKNKGSTGVLTMLDDVMQDSKKTEADAIKDEREAQADYETFVADSNASIQKMTDAITDKTEARAEATDDKTEAEGDLKSTEGELARLEQYNTDLHTQCDFGLKNFDSRQEARQGEIEGLQQAIQILSGAQM